MKIEDSKPPVAGPTPGPWHVGGRATQRIVYDANGWAVCDCTVYHTKCGMDTMNANARLIAASPQLMVALEDIMNSLPSRREWLDPALERMANEAIAEAKG